MTYQLNKAAARTDQSIVTWSSCEDVACANPRTMAVSRGGKVKTALQILAISWYLWPFPAGLTAKEPEEAVERRRPPRCRAGVGTTT